MIPPGGTSLSIRPVTARDDLAEGLDLWHRGFGPPDGGIADRRRAELTASLDGGRLLGAWEGSRWVGLALYEPMRQWWLGRELPMAGVSGVAVAPESRGRGVGRALMRELLSAMVAAGYPLSALYPATARLYRSLGWEIAGRRYVAEIPARSLTALLPPDPAGLDPAGPDAAPSARSEGGPGAGPGLGAAAHGPSRRASIRRAVAADAKLVIAALGASYGAQRDCGPATGDRDFVGRLLDDPANFCYLAPDGFLAYAWGADGDITVRILRAVTSATLRGLWSIVAGHAEIAGTVRAAIAPADPISWLTGEPDVALSVRQHWMLRILDPAAAISGRGFPPAASLDVPLVLADPEVPAAAGYHRLSIGAGQGTLFSLENESARRSPATVRATRFGPRGLAAMYAGVPLATLRRAGLVSGGDPETDASLDSAFGATACLLELF